MPRIEGEAGYIFTLDGRRPIAGIAKCKERLDRAMLEAARTERGEGATIPPWRLHDLRRTFVTGLAELGIRPDVIEAGGEPRQRHAKWHRGHLQQERIVAGAARRAGALGRARRRASCRARRRR